MFSRTVITVFFSFKIFCMKAFHFLDMKKKHYACKKSQLTFKNSWKKIDRSKKVREEKINYDNDFERNKPTFQEMLAKDNTITKFIDYSNYDQVSWDQLDWRSTFDCFHGILFYIFFNSENKLNLSEIEFHFSGADIISILNQQILKLPEILNLFEFNDINKEYKSVSVQNAFFGFKFLRIKVNPIAYAVRIGNSGKDGYNFTSFVFMGLNEKTEEWEILDERTNTNELINSNFYMLYYTKSTDQFYTAFKIQQTDTGSHNFWGFSIKNIEIHGYPQYLPYEKVNLFKEEIDTSIEIEDFEKDNPFVDMNDLIF